MSVVAGLLAELSDVGRDAGGGYNRQAWSSADFECRQWFVQCADALDLEVETDRNGNLWAWWSSEAPGQAVVVGSHLDSVPNGGAFDGPLGVASAFAAVALLRRDGFVPSRPIAVVAFADEEGARFGLACTGSRLMVGALAPDKALPLLDRDSSSMAEAMTRAGLDIDHVGRDEERVARIGEYIELHIEQGHLPTRDGHAGLLAADAPIGVADSIWPHGRWRVDFRGQQNHAGTTPMDRRRDPLIGLSSVVLALRSAAVTSGALATVGKVRVTPGAVNAVAGSASLWIDARAADEKVIRHVLADVRRMTGFTATQESWTAATTFDTCLTESVAAGLGGVPVLPSGAGHDAGVLALAGIPSAMILVRNPSGISHSPEEHADDDDCARGVVALVATLRNRAG